MKQVKQYECLGNTITVRRVTVDELPDDAVACYDSETHEILLLKTLSKDAMLHAFLHEHTHAALQALGRTELNDDEVFVDTFAGLLHQMLKSCK